MAIPWEGGDFPPFLYTEAPQAIAPPERSEALVGHTRCPSDELQQPQPLLVVKPLHCCPEPPDDYVSIVVAYTKKREERLKYVPTSMGQQICWKDPDPTIYLVVNEQQVPPPSCPGCGHCSIANNLKP